MFKVLIRIGGLVFSFSLLIVFSRVGSLKAQSGPRSIDQGENDKLTVGDVMPDITFNNLVNYKSSSAKLSDFKGKLVILDFWATTCLSLIHI